jgi:hypothetical protein
VSANYVYCLPFENRYLDDPDPYRRDRAGYHRLYFGHLCRWSEDVVGIAADRRSWHLGRDVLIVQSGPFKWKVPVAEITGITPTRNPLSSPALSLDRLRINYGDGNSLMVSPEDKEKFIADLDKLRTPLPTNAEASI